jgi:hypothetical protein
MLDQESLRILTGSSWVTEQSKQVQSVKMTLAMMVEQGGMDS